jgi:hypothetical protein
MIDSRGNLLTSASAYTTVTIGGTMQTPDEQAQQIVNRIAQLTSMAQGGREPSTLYAVVPFDATPPPTQLPLDTPANIRLAACKQYWASPTAYTGNPAQVTAPINGAAYGFVAYNTTSPPAGYDGIRLDSPTNLDTVQELWLTVEGDQVDPLNRGPVFMDSVMTKGGNDVVHFVLTGSSVSGTAAVEIHFDDNSVLF